MDFSFDYLSFSENKDIQELAHDSVCHISKIYPIYILMRYHAGNALTKDQLNYLDVLSDLVNQYDLDITLVINEQDAKIFHEYDSENNFKYLIHSCYDSKIELANNVAKIKNFTLKSAASRFGNKNISWIFLIDEGIRFIRLNHNYLTCTSPEHILISLAIWQYTTTKKIYSFLYDENEIGLTGITQVLDAPLYDAITYSNDKYLCSDALLINLSECYRKHIEFDLMLDLLEDIDFNANILANGMHIISMHGVIGIKQILSEYKSNRKISNFALNTWAKWGDKIINNLKVEDNKIKPIFAQDFYSIISEYNASNKHRINWPKNERLYAEYLNQKKKMQN